MTPHKLAITLACITTLAITCTNAHANRLEVSNQGIRFVKPSLVLGGLGGGGGGNTLTCPVTLEGTPTQD
jgi:hypothetical protein